MAHLTRPASPRQPQHPHRTTQRPLPMSRAMQDHGTTSRAAQDTPLFRFTFEVQERHGPALRSALEEITDAVASRAERPHSYAVEDALAGALCSLGALRAAVYPRVPAGDPYYPRRKS